MIDNSHHRVSPKSASTALRVDTYVLTRRIKVCALSKICHARSLVRQRTLRAFATYSRYALSWAIDSLLEACPAAGRKSRCETSSTWKHKPCFFPFRRQSSFFTVAFPVQCSRDQATPILVSLLLASFCRISTLADKRVSL
jgi:hypothetical protein